MGWNRVRGIGRRLGLALLLTFTLAVGILPAAQSQPVVTTISNSQLTATIGVSGQPQNVTPAINAAGRFEIATNATPSVLLLQAFGGVTNQSYVTVRIDGGPPTPGVDADSQTSPGWDLIFGDVGSNALDGSNTNQKTTQGAWLQVPTLVTSNQLTAKWTTLPGGNTTFPIPSIEVDLTMTVIHDMVVYRFTVINKDSSAHIIGLRFVQDYTANGVDGPVLTPTTGSISHETSLTGLQVPPSWLVENKGTGDTVGAALPARVDPGDITRPDQLSFGQDPDFNSLWTFTPDPTKTFGTKPGEGGTAAIYFNPRQLFGGGQSQTFVAYVGKQHSTIDFARPFAAGVDGPFSLKLDTTKPAGQQLTPNPFTVTAFVYNPLEIPLTNVSAFLNLPKGLKLADDQTNPQTTASLATNGEAAFTWQVVPTGEASGILTYTVSFGASPGGLSKSVSRSIEVPALPSVPVSAGLSMVSFPFVFDNPTPSVALGLSTLDFDILRYNTQTQQYEAVSTLVPGQGYWLNFRKTGQTVNLQGARPVPTNGNFEIRLVQGKDGWNQIGNPFLYRLRWADVLVLNTDSTDPDAFKIISIQTASDLQHQWILPTIYWYDTSSQAYVWNTDMSADLVPDVGYWVRTMKPNISFLLPPVVGRAAAPIRRAAAAKPGPTNWTLRVFATAPDAPGTWSVLGIMPGASDGYDLQDVQEPPAIRNRVDIGFVRPDWGKLAGRYVQDVQAASGGRKQWNLLVTSPAPDTDVTLSWPDISNLPKGYELYITDSATGQRKLMRQTSSLRVNTGPNASRAITVTAEPRNRAVGFHFLDWSVRPVGRGTSAAISVTTNQDATLTVRVLNGAGIALRTLATRAAVTGQPTRLTWDYRDGKGVAVPAGAYLVEIRGTTPDGQSARVSVPHVVIR
jgi:hypothetical protein